jgi:hypothetical protein
VPHAERSERNGYKRQWWKTPRGREVQRVCRLNGRAQLRAFYESLKAGKPCADCGGVFDPECMDWDHVRGVKRFNVKQAVASRLGRATLLREVDKCELVCANCHRLRTKQRRAQEAA